MPFSPPFDGIIEDIENGERIIFHSLVDFSEGGVDANYDDALPRGRSQALRFYTGTSQKSVSVSLILAASIGQFDFRTPQDVLREYRFIESFAYPEYAGSGGTGIVRPPHRARIKYGNMLDYAGFIRSPTSTPRFPVDELGLPFRLEVSFTFNVFYSTPPDFRTIRESLDPIARRVSERLL